ncbi:MAG: hypothetical protein KBD23_01030 [Gammaproteobacteria bacterium]|nr:hypothetical protein [Gammaproteobacteria bacterium]
MTKPLQTLFLNWPKAWIHDSDLAILLKNSTQGRYGLVKRALAEGSLIRLKRGFYLIGKPYKQDLPSLYEVAQLLYGPSYISLESALSYHQWIPEAVYTTTSVTPKRQRNFETPLGLFHFATTPLKNFYEGVQKIDLNDTHFLMASAIKALADYIHVHKKSWKNIEEMSIDLRIEPVLLSTVDAVDIRQLAACYPNKRVQKFMSTIMLELSIS